MVTKKETEVEFESNHSLVQATQKRLASLGLSKETVDYYLEWAYQQALNQNNDLDDSKYEYYLNRLPNISSTESLLNPKRPQPEDEPNEIKPLKQMTLEETVEFLSTLLSKNQSSLLDVEVIYYHGEIHLDDGYIIPVRIMDSVRISELGETLATREGFENTSEYTVLYCQQETMINLSTAQTQETLNEIVEANGDRLVYSFKDESQISIIFKSQETLTYFPIETLKSEVI